MTANEQVVDLPVEDPATPTRATPRVAPGQRRLHANWRAVGVVLGLLVPLAVMTRFAIHSPPEFDGVMNLQVADNVTNGLGYAREYGGTVPFPPEIQTSGAYIFLAAGLIKIFGAHTFVFELPNLISLTILLAAVSSGTDLEQRGGDLSQVEQHVQPDERHGLTDDRLRVDDGHRTTPSALPLQRDGKDGEPGGVEEVHVREVEHQGLRLLGEGVLHGGAEGSDRRKVELS